MLLLATMLLLCSCGRKPIQSVIEKKSTDTLAVVKTTVTDNSKPINAQLVIPVPIIKSIKPECDSIAQAALDDAIRRMNVIQRSGDNKFQLLYDEHTRLLTMYADLAATKNVLQTTDTTKKHTDSEKARLEIPVPYVPKLYKYSAWFGWVCAALFLNYLINKARNSIRI